jgi:hypothetical protein
MVPLHGCTPDSSRGTRYSKSSGHLRHVPTGVSACADKALRMSPSGGIRPVRLHRPLDATPRWGNGRQTAPTGMGPSRTVMGPSVRGSGKYRHAMGQGSRRKPIFLGGPHTVTEPLWGVIWRVGKWVAGEPHVGNAANPEQARLRGAREGGHHVYDIANT